MNIWRVIWFVLIFVFDVYVIYWSIKRNYYKERFEDTKMTLPHLGHMISINGAKGKGKSTFSAAYTLVVTEYLYNHALEWNEDIRISLPDFDFNFIEDSFDEIYVSLELESGAEELAVDVVLNSLDREKFNCYYTNFLSIELKQEMIRDYLLNYWILNYRGVDTYASGYIFNFVSGKLGKQLDPTSSYIRKVSESKNYQGGFYTIKFNDEKSIQSGNEKSSSSEIRNSGVRDYSALKRHEGKATCFDISPAQVAIDVNAQERRQNDINLDIFDRSDSIADFKLLRKIIDIFLLILKLPILICLKIKSFFKRLDYTELQDQFFKKCGKWRKIEFYFTQLKKMLKRMGYIRYRCKAYYNAEDVGKKNPDTYDKHMFYFPIYYCYGVINTYEYAPVMKNYSKMNENAVNKELDQFDHEARIALFEEVIKN